MSARKRQPDRARRDRLADGDLRRQGVRRRRPDHALPAEQVRQRGISRRRGISVDEGTTRAIAAPHGHPSAGERDQERLVGRVHSNVSFRRFGPAGKSRVRAHSRPATAEARLCSAGRSESVSYAKYWCCEQMLIMGTRTSQATRRDGGEVPAGPGLTVGWSDNVNEEWRDMKNLFSKFVREESGQDLIEYALLAGFISLVAVLAITNVGTGVNNVYNGIDTQVKAIPGAS